MESSSRLISSLPSGSPKFHIRLVILYEPLPWGGRVDYMWVLERYLGFRVRVRLYTSNLGYISAEVSWFAVVMALRRLVLQ